MVTTVYSLQSTVYSLQSTVYSLQSNFIKSIEFFYLSGINLYFAIAPKNAAAFLYFLYFIHYKFLIKIKGK